jgi:tRNA A37 N6-isopentenylltransferase MiaA
MGSVIKKRGRPLGSKNKPKTRIIRMTKAQVALGKKLGVTPEQYAKSLVDVEKKEKAALARKKRATVKKFDWAVLAKQLEEALREEIKNNNELNEKVSDLNFQASNLVHQAIGYRAIISYLENKHANNPV